MAHGVMRTRNAHDARLGAFLWRHGGLEERALVVHAQLHRARRHHAAVGRDRLLARVRIGHGRRLHRRLRVRLLEWRRPRAARGVYDPPYPVHGVPDDVRHHHSCADLGRHRRTNEVLGILRLHHPVGHVGLRPHLPLGLGTGWLARCARRARLRGRHGRSSLVGCRRVGVRHRPRSTRPPRSASQPHSDFARCRHALVRLVRVQRGQRAGRE